MGTTGKPFDLANSTEGVSPHLSDTPSVIRWRSDVVQGECSNQYAAITMLRTT